MKQKFTIFIIAFALLLVMIPKHYTLANTTDNVNDDIKYKDIEEFMHTNGYTDFKQNSGCLYFVTKDYYNKNIYVHEVSGINALNPYMALCGTRYTILFNDGETEPVINWYQFYNFDNAKQFENYTCLNTGIGASTTACTANVQATYQDNNKRSYFAIMKGIEILYSDLDIYKLEWNGNNTVRLLKSYDNLIFENSLKPKVEDEILDASLKLQDINNLGFKYNGMHYDWNSSQKEYMILENLTDYLVFYDDYNKQLIFVWAFDDLIAQAKMQKSGLRFYSYYYEFITEPNNSSVLPYCYSVYQINSDGTLDCINSLQNEKAENNHQFSFGWTNPIYEPQLDNIDNFSTYEEYILNNNLIASNCDIYNNSGVLVKSAVTLNNDLITPDEVPETEIGTLKYYLYEKLPIIRTVEVFVKKFNVVLESMKESGEPPEIIMNFDNYYGFGGEVNVLDVSWYEDYREPVKAILSAILIMPFILWVYKKGLPEAIGGI